jgi:hypothetical protein
MAQAPSWEGVCRWTDFDWYPALRELPAQHSLRGKEFIRAACLKTHARCAVLLLRYTLQGVRNSGWMPHAGVGRRTLDTPRELMYSGEREHPER